MSDWLFWWKGSKQPIKWLENVLRYEVTVWNFSTLKKHLLTWIWQKPTALTLNSDDKRVKSHHITNISTKLNNSAIKGSYQVILSKRVVVFSILSLWNKHPLFNRGSSAVAVLVEISKDFSFSWVNFLNQTIKPLKSKNYQSCSQPSHLNPQLPVPLSPEAPKATLSHWFKMGNFQQ